MEQNAAHLTAIERLLTWFDANKKQVLVGAGVCVAVGLGVSLYVWYQDEKEGSAAEALSTVLAPQALAGPTRMESADAYLKVANEHPGTRAAGRAVLNAAANIYTQGKYPEAQAQFARFLREYADSPFRVLAQFGVATCLDAQGKTDEALRAYKELADRYPGENVAPQAKFALGRLYESKNMLKEAVAVYGDISRSHPYGSIAPEAALRAEELKTKYPALAPAPVPVPAPVSLPRPLSSFTTSNINAP